VSGQFACRSRSPTRPIALCNPFVDPGRSQANWIDVLKVEMSKNDDGNSRNLEGRN
jgi:hypothetical protein